MRRRHVMARIRRRFTYGNVMATLALFVAMGGTSYAALKFPRNSVGTRELKSRSVGASELRTKAVTSRAIKDRGIRLRDMSKSARASLRGTQGPAGPQGPQGPAGLTYYAVVNSGGQSVLGNATGGGLRGVNEYIVRFDRSVAACAMSATPARVPGGLVTDPQPGSTVIVAPTADGAVQVRTFNASNAAQPLPFHLIVAC
jgi:hypothetical protein